MIRHHVDQRRRQGRSCRSGAVHDVHKTLRRKMHDDLRGADHWQGPDGPGIDQMKHRRGVQPDIALGERETHERVERAADHIAICQANSLRVAGRAAGVIDLRDVGGIDFGQSRIRARIRQKRSHSRWRPVGNGPFP